MRLDRFDTLFFVGAQDKVAHTRGQIECANGVCIAVRLTKMTSMILERCAAPSDPSSRSHAYTSPLSRASALSSQLAVKSQLMVVDR
ncbi:hypothetical protein BCR43DRAFT_110232 [Syncephalastrum racemosum]|uniref:Uncharacterized protein n=1 Tax=Syncephalastrum racemosum TaxID=13706 RepID=A0A1X2H125_SYNRA|nr:hypothetical protein BCR43DRAFT_110232 [Syncephalastrum racemosum]